MKKKGFTLVELLAVIAILAILVIMALPAVLKMYNKARIDTFSNELNTIIRTARQQYLLSGGQAGTYSKDSNPLSLTGNSELNYCITINEQGQITGLQATNGSYKYESNGIVEEASNDDITEISGSFALQCGPIKYVNRQNEGQITVNDEIAIGSEHFYVISSDSTNTVLLAKYNLLVGDVFNKSGNTWLFTKTLSSSDPGYGLQSESAKGIYSGATDYTGVVAFSGKAYWDNKNCVWSGSGESVTCPGTAGLNGEYANSANAEGTNNYRTPYPYVYNSNMSSIEPSYGEYMYQTQFRAANDNGYTIAYYVERYVNTLKSIGAPNNIVGRLLTYEEANALSSTIKGTWSYWLGSAPFFYRVWSVGSGRLGDNYFWYDAAIGVRPVIIVPTNVIPN